MAAKAKKDTKGDTKRRLVVLDTHAILHRAYHALPDFSSSRGEPTGALYGVVSMITRIITDLKPDYIIAATTCLAAPFATPHTKITKHNAKK